MRERLDRPGGAAGLDAFGRLWGDDRWGAPRFRGTLRQERKDRLTDLFWTLLNTTEFSWNH